MIGLIGITHGYEGPDQRPSKRLRKWIWQSDGKRHDNVAERRAKRKAQRQRKVRNRKH